jgi:lysophospholipase L1-like esterase
MIQTSAFGPDGRPPLVLLVAPPPTCVAGTRFEDMFAGSDEKSPRLGHYYKLVADEFGCAFLDAGEHIASSSVDGIHLDAAELPKLAQAVGAKVREVVS